jgi:hypothetical protein
MALDSGTSQLETTVVLMDQLLDQVGQGRLRVPAFQRAFEWRPEQMLDLFDSIERGYPIGSLLLWETDEPMETMEAIGEIPVPRDTGGRVVSYLLDGHQRVSTLFGTLRRPREMARGAAESDWRWRIYRDLQAGHGTERYRHHRARNPVPLHYLPLRAVSRTLDFLQFSRELELSDLSPDMLEDMVRQAEAVADKIKNFHLPLIRLIGGNLDQAVEVFTRLNRKGLRMDGDQMVSALTYRDKRFPPLANRIDDIVGAVAETGFGVVPRRAVFQTVLALAGEQDLLSPRWEAVADRLGNKLHNTLPDAQEALLRAVEFLQNTVKLPLARLLPYPYQLMLLGYFFHHCEGQTTDQLETLRRWFWITSWTAAFADANSTSVRRALQEMKAFADGEELPLDSDGLRPMPEQFNVNSGRTRAYLIWELLEFPKRLNAVSGEIELVTLIASGDSQVFRPVFEQEKSPANRVVLPTRRGTSVRRALVEIWQSFDGQRILASHGIPIVAGDRLAEENGPEFIRARTEFLVGRLEKFVAGLGVPVGEELIGEATDDTE